MAITRRVHAINYLSVHKKADALQDFFNSGALRPGERMVQLYHDERGAQLLLLTEEINLMTEEQHGKTTKST